MKNKATIILAIILLTMIGCQKPQELDANKGSSDSSKVVLENGQGEKENSSNIENNNGMKEFSITLEGKQISLMDWDDEADLEGILGKAQQEDLYRLGAESDTFAGSYMKEIQFSGLAIKLFSPKDNGTKFYILSMETDDPKYQTIRGIKVGDSLEDLSAKYPELIPIPDGREDANNRGYSFQDGAYNYITFEVENGVIVYIRIYHEFA